MSTSAAGLAGAAKARPEVAPPMDGGQFAPSDASKGRLYRAFYICAPSLSWNLSPRVRSLTSRWEAYSLHL